MMQRPNVADLADPRWSDASLNAARRRGDPLADQVVAGLYADGDVGRTNRLLQRLAARPGVVPVALPDAVEDFLAQASIWPAWASPEAVHLGQEVFARYSMPALGALLYRSLPECYACAHGVQVLALSQRIDSLVHRRIAETLQMVVDVMTPGSLRPGKRGLRSAQRVRLLHAALRRLVGQERRYRAAAWGVPINQEDLAFTLTTFGVSVLDCLYKAGARLSPAEEQAYHHAWRLIGHVMGVEEALLPATAAEARALRTRVAARQHGATPEGAALERALLGFADGVTPGELFDGVNPTLTRYLAGDRVADLLGVAPTDFTRGVIPVYTALVRWADRGQHQGNLIERELWEKVGLAFMRKVLAIERGGEAVTFELPQSLQDQWTRPA